MALTLRCCIWDWDTEPVAKEGSSAKRSATVAVTPLPSKVKQLRLEMVSRFIRLCPGLWEKT
jgi:hypothetical protein